MNTTSAATTADTRSIPIRIGTVLRILSVLLLFAIWEIAARWPISYAFPSFLETMAALFEMTVDGRMATAYADTLVPLCIGVAISSFFGISIGIAMGLHRQVQWTAEPVFIIMQAAPMAALIPLVTYIWGISVTAKVVAVVALAAPVIVLNAYKAVRNANQSLIQMCRSFQGTRMQEILKVIVPDASPMIFAGLRLGVASGFIGAILAELLITPTGIGDLITYHRSVAEYAHMYAAVFSIMVFAAVTVGLLETIEVKFFRPESRKAH